MDDDQDGITDSEIEWRCIGIEDDGTNENSEEMFRNEYLSGPNFNFEQLQFFNDNKFTY